MWFLFSLITALCWGGADLFYKKGTDSNDLNSHLKIVIMVGLVMGVHAVGYMLITGAEFSPFRMVEYFPVSALYILSMALGYIGLRYLALSIASPIQNSSGAVSAILCCLFFVQALTGIEVGGIIAVTVGIIGLGVVEKRLAPPPLPGERRYVRGAMALIFPLLYCLIDGLGTFADAVYLDELSLMNEADALLAYEFTFFLCALVVWAYLRLHKNISFSPFREKDTLFAAVLETAGQFFYVYAMADNAVIAAPLVASYSIFSVILSRIFLKEKLTRAHYATIAVVIAGIALLGLADAL